MRDSKSLALARKYIGQEVDVIIDRPLGSLHPEFDFVYEVNYGHIEGVKAPDGEDLDAYCLGWDIPLKTARGRVAAIIHRRDDDDDKLVVVVPGFNPNDSEIIKTVDFQEKWFRHEIIRH